MTADDQPLHGLGLEQLADGEQALRRYLAVSAGGVPSFSGSMFEAYGNNPRADVVGDDLVAVTLLSIEISGLRPRHPGFAPDHLLALERQRDAIADLLRALPDDVELHELPEDRAYDLLAWRVGTPAFELYQLVRRGLGIEAGPGAVATYKLLARKRPRLLPIRDREVQRHLGHRADPWWMPWWHSLQAHELVERLRALQQATPDTVRPSLLRTADIVLWMGATGRWPIAGAAPT